MCGVALHVRGAAWSLPAAHGRAVDPHTHVRQWARQMDDVRSAVSRLFLHGRSSTAPQAQSLRPIDLTGVLRHHAMRVVSTGTGVAVQIFTEYAACALRPTVARRGGWGGGGRGAQALSGGGTPVLCFARNGPFGGGGGVTTAAFQCRARCLTCWDVPGAYGFPSCGTGPTICCAPWAACTSGSSLCKVGCCSLRTCSKKAPCVSQGSARLARAMRGPLARAGAFSETIVFTSEQRPIFATAGYLGALLGTHRTRRCGQRRAPRVDVRPRTDIPPPPPSTHARVTARRRRRGAPYDSSQEHRRRPKPLRTGPLATLVRCVPGRRGAGGP